MASSEYDVIVIGSGPAGYWASLIACIRGLKVAVVEERKVGGTCLNYGCVPLITALNYLSSIDMIKKLSSENSGIILGGLTVSVAEMFKYVNHNVTSPISDSMKKTLEDLGAEIICGKAVLVDEHTANVGGKHVRFKKAVISTGLSWNPISSARPSTEFTLIEEIPSKLLIIGANPFGLPIASLFGLLGSEVLVVEESSQILEGFDREVCEYLMMLLGDINVKIMLNTKLSRLVSSGNVKEVVLSTPDGEVGVGVDEVIDATHYTPRLDVLGNVDVKLHNGYIWTDEYLRTSLNNIYAAGDVVGTSLYAHTAIAHGIIAGENVSGGSMRVRSSMPRYVFTYPEVVSVGLTEDDARRLGYEISIARQSLTSNAVVRGVRGSGMVKVIVDSKYGGILGIHAVGHRVTEIINESIVTISLESTAESLINTYLAHPTVGEELRNALIQVFKP